MGRPGPVADRREPQSPPQAVTMQEHEASSGETASAIDAPAIEAVEPEKPKFDAPMITGSSSRELDLAGAENLSVAGKMGMMHPFVLLAAMGMMQSAPWAALVALFGWVAVVGGLMGGSKSLTTSARASKLDSPSGAMSKGFAAIGGACLAALVCGGLGDTPTSFMVLNGLWAALTMVAVKSATKTDAQSGWIAGATSQTAAALFFGVPLALIPGLTIPFVVKLTPFLSGISLFYSWKTMSARGTQRSRYALNAAGAAALATLAFLPATAALIGFSPFEALCHFTVSMGSLALPIWTMRNKMRAALPAAETADRPALPSE